MKAFIKTILCGLLFFIIGCSNNIEFTEYQSTTSQKWHKDSIKKFQFLARDTINKHTIYLQLRNNKEYEFNNIYLIIEADFPNNQKLIDTLQYLMTDSKGYFLGSGLTDIKESKLEYKTDIKFSVSGEYQFKIQHAMRKLGDQNGLVFLNGITDVGLQIERIKTKK